MHKNTKETHMINCLFYEYQVEFEADAIICFLKLQWCIICVGK